MLLQQTLSALLAPFLGDSAGDWLNPPWKTFNSYAFSDVSLNKLLKNSRVAGDLRNKGAYVTSL